MNKRFLYYTGNYILIIHNSLRRDYDEKQVDLIISLSYHCFDRL